MRECECLMAHWLQLIVLWSVKEGTHGGRRGEHPSLLALGLSTWHISKKKLVLFLLIPFLPPK